MTGYVLGFLLFSLGSLFVGSFMGLMQGVAPELAGFYGFRVAHVHLQTFGFVGGMIFAVGYHVFPRFSGNPIRSSKAAWVQLVFCVLGTPTFVFALMGPEYGLIDDSRILWMAFGGTLMMLAAWIFVANIVLTVWPVLKQRFTAFVQQTLSRNRAET